MSVNFPPLQQAQVYTNPNGTFTLAYVTFWQQFRNELQGALDTITSQQAQIVSALNAAGIALAAANGAQETADASARELARINSYATPTAVLTAADTGTDATITIANHTRVYPVQGSIDVPDVAITGGEIPGLLFATKYFVYYDDTTLADTTPNFIATTNQALAQVGSAAGRHFVGEVTTPADGGGGTSGGGGYPPGGGGGPIP